MKEKKKVLFFTPGNAGGAERMTLTFAKLLPEERFDVKIIVIGVLDQIYSFIPSGMSYDTVPVLNKYCFSTYRIYRKIKKECPDLVFVSQSSYNPRVIIAARLAGVKIIVRSSGMVGTYPKSSIFRVKHTYRHATHLIAQQEEMRQEMSQLLDIPLSRITTINNPIDYATIDARIHAASPFESPNQINLVNVARISWDKGQDIAVSAFPEIKKSYPNAHLFFIGNYNRNDSFYIRLCSLIADLHLEDCVHIMGFDPNPYRWIKYSDCFVFPSRREGLPNALIEASYLGIPCAASRCLAIVDDIIKNDINGYKCEVEDIAGLTAAVINSLKLKSVPMLYTPSDSSHFIGLVDRLCN